MWNNIPREEQETTINLNYKNKTINLYTTRYAVANKLKKKIGEPSKINYSNNKIDSIEYFMKMDDNRVRKLLSLGAIILKPTKLKDKIN